METLPSWVWGFYYGFILIALVSSIVYLIRKQRKLLATLTIVSAVFGPIIFFLQSLLRASGTEMDNLWHSLGQGKIWALFVLLALMEMLLWFVTLMKDLFGQWGKTNSLKT
ncbi:hypothetical protein [Brevibacillus agri]|uniref:hypothetical protein n=1 Tax=Brevibacillus agri TaxID=51101 RepID=UPI0004716D70|nr:hypothetical protein [Brevibacillus agri]MED4571654.1 hypothetical protein [Brevibacillus agri]WHX31298.1 hypothetical protein QNK09_03370 [Brevibacillus agri]